MTCHIIDVVLNIRLIIVLKTWIPNNSYKIEQNPEFFDLLDRFVRIWVSGLPVASLDFFLPESRLHYAVGFRNQ